MQHWELLVFFFIIAFVYASVGFGGGSSYLAILALYAIPFQEMKLTALICNIVVVTGGTFVFLRNRQINWKKILPLIITSIPMAFLGARLKLKEDIFFIVLGCSLIIASILLWIKMKNIKTVSKPHILKDAGLGGLIGFLSGMVGIGGGIFLSPLLNLSGWDTSKKIAAAASLFILVNSIAGIAGQLSGLSVELNYTRITLLVVAVLAGGQLGSWLSAVKFDLLVVRRMTALLVLVAGIEVLVKHMHLFS